jgi:hypothetical protein
VASKLKNVGREQVYWFFPQVQNMMSLLAHRHLFFSSVKDDNEPKGSSSSVCIFF